MIRYVKGNILDDTSKVLVCPVNCVGVMGKGLALQFKEKFPDLLYQYASTCRMGAYYPGRVWMHANHLDDKANQFIACMATKDHWRDPSKLEWVDEGLKDLRYACDVVLRKAKSRDVAIPPVGCGCGGLKWENVKPLIEKHFADYDGTVTVYEQ